MSCSGSNQLCFDVNADWRVVVGRCARPKQQLGRRCVACEIESVSSKFGLCTQESFKTVFACTYILALN